MGHAISAGSASIVSNISENVSSHVPATEASVDAALFVPPINGYSVNVTASNVLASNLGSQLVIAPVGSAPQLSPALNLGHNTRDEDPIRRSPFRVVADLDSSDCSTDCTVGLISVLITFPVVSTDLRQDVVGMTTGLPVTGQGTHVPWEQPKQRKQKIMKRQAMSLQPGPVVQYSLRSTQGGRPGGGF